jgi:excisionase family DNA binding protein
MSETTNSTEQEPLAVSPETAVKLTGLSRSKIYNMIASGELVTSLVGRRRLVHYGSLKSLLSGSIAA